MKRTLAAIGLATVFGCSEGALSDDANARVHPDGLVQQFALRESNVAVRDLPGWAPP